MIEEVPSKVDSRHSVNAHYRPVKLWFDPKQIATETVSPVLIQEISPEHHIKNII